MLFDVTHAFAPEPGRHIGVAVSGGGDSIALLHLIVRDCRHQNVPVSAVTVDHQLRNGSADEAKAVAMFCASLNVPHSTVPWVHGAIDGNMMDVARQARMSLIADWARARGVTHIALGHTSDDQAESFLMALSRSAGLDGLVGMRPRWRSNGLSWSRPLLGIKRADLRAYLMRHAIEWTEDPTNDDSQYERVRARNAMKALVPLGLDADKIGMTILNLQMSKWALDAILRRAAKDHVVEVAGALRVNFDGFDALPHDVQRQLLVKSVGWLSGKSRPPRWEKQTNLLFAGRDRREVTIHGCRLRVKKDHLLLTREPKAVAALAGRTDNRWDNRWIVEGPPGEVRALGTKGLPQVKGWRDLGLPREVLLVTPAVWDGDTLLAAPVAGMENGWKARIATPFHRFLVSD